VKADKHCSNLDIGLYKRNTDKDCNTAKFLPSISDYLNVSYVVAYGIVLSYMGIKGNSIVIVE